MKRWKTCLLMAMIIGITGIAMAGSSPITIKVDTKQTKEPISKYIYGQFIEHLGRCIYGGIWAEMLQDRKFYFPVKDEFKPWSTETDRGHWNGGDFPVLTGSPWKVLGKEHTVEMVKEKSYAGDQTPEIHLAGDGTFCGIEQGELALEKGKPYVGYLIAAGENMDKPLQIKLIWGDSDNDQETIEIESVGNDYTKYPFRFNVTKSVEHGRLQIGSSGNGTLLIGTVSLMPADNVQGFRADTLALLKELNSPVYRWPGGNFVSDYNWKDGIGDRDKRPPRKNPAWTGIEPNDVGIHEFMQLCSLINAEPYIAINTGKGDIEAAKEEVEYCNGSTDTAMGKWRAENGHPKPFQVKFWAIGNEMYGNWQLGHMPLEEYVKKHNACVAALKAIDPSIQVVAVGNVGNWSRTMLTNCADSMDLISEHIYCKNKDNLVAHVEQLADAIKRVANAHRDYRKTIPALKDKDIRIAMDEWNYWYGPYIYGELGVQYHLQDALGVAEGLHEYFRNSDLYYMANYAQTVNVIGAIKTSKTAASFDTTGLVLKLYRNHYGQIPVSVGEVPKPLDVAAALSKDGKFLTVSIVNPTEKTQTWTPSIDGVTITGKGICWTITGFDKMACNVPGVKPEVTIDENALTSTADNYSLKPISVTLYQFALK